MGGIIKAIAVVLVGFALSACVSNDTNYAGAEAISIPYDPYDFDPKDLLAEAQAHCQAYGLRAVYEDETVDPQSVRWRYRHYRCV